MLRDFKVIFFDVGGTLLHPYPSVGEIYSRTAKKYGNETDAQTIEELFRKEWLKRDGLGSLVSHSSEKIERDWWHAIVLDVFNQCGGVEDFDSFFDELYLLFASPENWRIYPDSIAMLKSLKAGGKRLAAISNWDSRLMPLLESLELHEFFETVLVSAVFGASKPSPKIFEEALRRMDVCAEDSVHIGDSLEDDVKGATSIGMNAILIDRHEKPRKPLEGTYQNVKIIRNFSELNI